MISIIETEKKIDKQTKEIRNIKIKAMYLGGYTMKEIATQYKLSEPMISRIINKAK